MLIGNNTLMFFEDKTLQRWTTADNKNIYPYFGINIMPAFVLISDTAETTATVQVFNATTDVAYGLPQDVAVSTNNTKKMLYFAGITLAAGVAGCYYLKIVTGATVETYYSEVFSWTTDSAANLKELGMLKITATSSNYTLANLYNMTLTGIIYECFIEVQPPTLEAVTDEEGNEKPQGNIPTFNTLAFEHKYDVFGTEGIYRFLSWLRQLETNGTVTFTYKGVAKSAYDIICELDSATEDTTAMTLKYKESDFSSVRNAIFQV